MSEGVTECGSGVMRKEGTYALTREIMRTSIGFRRESTRGIASSAIALASDSSGTLPSASHFLHVLQSRKG